MSETTFELDEWDSQQLAAAEQRLADLAAAIGLPSERAAECAELRQRQLTKPEGSLGRLEELATWWCAVTDKCPSAPPTRPRLVIFAGDHGITEAGTSAYPANVTAQMVANLVNGGAAANVLARHSGAGVRVLDIGVDATWSDEDPSVPRSVAAHKVTRGTRRFDVEDALERSQALACLLAGVDVADEEIDAGADLLMAGEMGIGNTSSAAAIVGLLTRHGAAEVVGRGTGIDDEGWMRKCAAVRDGLYRARRLRADPVGVLAAIGGAEIAAISGFLLGAAARGVPVILDGMVVTAAALVTEVFSYRARQWWLAGHRSVEPAHSLALEALRLEPLLDYRMRLGEGTGALLALQILSGAAATLEQMATFAEAGVSERSEGSDTSERTAHPHELPVGQESVAPAHDDPLERQ